VLEKVYHPLRPSALPVWETTTSLKLPSYVTNISIPAGNLQGPAAQSHPSLGGAENETINHHSGRIRKVAIICQPLICPRFPLSPLAFHIKLSLKCICKSCIMFFAGGCSSMVEPQPSKLVARVRFPLPAPFLCPCGSAG
jgi:hypothetical protein